ncbi:unnamed protein product [Prunus brigantina]
MNGCLLQSITTPRKACKAWSASGIVKHGGVTPINLGKSRPLL